MSLKQGAEHGRRLFVVLCTLFIVIGLSLIAGFVQAQKSPAEPGLTSSQQAAEEAAPTDEAAPSPETLPSASSPSPVATAVPAPSAPSRPAARSAVAKPVGVSIAAIGVTSIVNQTGLDRDGAIQAPTPGPQYDQTAWFTGSPRPGQTGPAVIIGHVDGPGDRASVFFKLRSLQGGNRVMVSRADNTVVAFEIYRVERYAKNDFPTRTVYGNTDRPELRLITCGGEFDRVAGNYRDNIVAYARIVAAT